jgi:hypothetical protein
VPRSPARTSDIGFAGPSKSPSERALASTTSGLRCQGRISPDGTSDLFRQLAGAARRAVDFAREFVEEHLPAAVRFRVELNSSYDGNPLHTDERVYPDDRRVHLAEHIARMEMEGLVELLWRDGAIPEWINLSVESADEEATLIHVESCGRFTANDALLYYEHEGRTPFHVLGPALPPDRMRDHPGRFSLWWSTLANQPAITDPISRYPDRRPS